MSETCLRSCERSGLTLVEVIASVALMTTLLVGLLTAHSRHIKQIKLADEKQIAIDLADGLVADWFASDETLPQNASGAFFEAGYTWKSVRVAGSIDNPEWNAAVIQLSVWSVAHDKPLVTLELLSENPIVPMRPTSAN